MPIAAQVPVEFDRRITVPHVTSAPCECRGGYGSIRVKIRQQKLRKKPLNRSDADESSSDDDEDGSSGSSSSGSATFAKLSALSAREWMTVFMLATANLGSTTAFSCIAPFYPNEAKRKGLNNFETGIVFGIFELVMFIVAPILGKRVNKFCSYVMIPDL
ncbi:unnamed protein product [Gongylonema pulchrum]|uniref:MFS domain-containing protein n=1 Tax=Gongylonema pulchrum TaxID=637853 RepID=A0A183D2J6_9BILA|nr:unnamed protein product [Gongylonema pulchrum]